MSRPKSPWLMRSYSVVARIRVLVAVLLLSWWIIFASIAVLGAFVYDVRHDAATEGIVASIVLALVVLMALFLPGRLLAWLDQ